MAANVTISSSTSQGVTITFPIMLDLEINGNYSCMALGTPLLTQYINGSAIKFRGETRNYTGTRLRISDTRLFERELSYVGSSTWNGQTTYYFYTTAKPYTNTTNLHYILSNTSNAASFANTSLYMELYLYRMCILGNGIPTTLLGHISIGLAQAINEPSTSINFSFNLISFTSTFNQTAFNNLMTHAINGSQLMNTTSVNTALIITGSGLIVSTTQANLSLFFYNPTNTEGRLMDG